MDSRTEKFQVEFTTTIGSDVSAVRPLPLPYRASTKRPVLSFNVAVLLGCTSTGRVGLWFRGSTSRNTQRLNRHLFWFQSVSDDGAKAHPTHPTDWERPGIEPATPGLQDIGLTPYTTAAQFYTSTQALRS